MQTSTDPDHILHQQVSLIVEQKPFCTKPVNAVLPPPQKKSPILHHSFERTWSTNSWEGGVRRFQSPQSHSQWFPRWRVQRGSWGCVAPRGQQDLYPPGGVVASVGSLGRGAWSCKDSKKAS